MMSEITVTNGGESPIAPGKSGTVSTVVNESNTAKTVGSGSLDVFATPMMIALMEQAACACLSPGMKPGQTSVGTRVNVSHTSASPLGATITAVATIASASGRRVEFEVMAKDESGVIGKGTHTRSIIEAESFMAKVTGCIEDTVT